MNRILFVCLFLALGMNASAQGRYEQVREIARKAYIWGYPVVDNYSVLYKFSFDTKSEEYKGPVNTISHARTVAGPHDRAFVAPNVDTPYSYAWLDLRAEPVVLTIPSFEKERYVSLQLIDAYTYIIDYVTPRTRGNAGGDFLVAGPSWNGQTPPGIKAVFRPTTDLALAFYRTQILDNHTDIDAVHELQDKYLVRTLSTYLKTRPPSKAASLSPLEPVDVRKDPVSLRFFDVLNWMMAYMPALPEDKQLRAEMEQIGVRPGQPFLAPEVELRTAIVDGMKQGLQEMQVRASKVRSSAELFGSREFLGQDYLIRAVAAMIGIYGNAEEEFLGVGYQGDSTGQPFDGKYAYTITFEAGKLPPVGAFWSITVYTQERFLYANPLNRYSISSLKLPLLRKNEDGGVTLYVQHSSPGVDKESNWLPVPATPFTLTFRTYLPGEAIRFGTWSAPPVIKAQKG